MGVKPERTAPAPAAPSSPAPKNHARGHGARFLTVKTLSSRDSDPAYAKTRAFYEAMGFVAIDEFPGL